MSSLKLYIPKRDALPGADPELRPRAVAKWLTTLPTGNAVEAALQLRARLRRINQIHLPSDARYTLLALFRPVVTKAIAAMKIEYAGVGFPLAEKNCRTANSIQQVLEEMACGYKIVVADRAPDEATAASTHAIVRDHVDPIFVEAVYHAMVYLSRRLVESYHVYAPEPERVWKELHALFAYSERQLVHVLPVPGVGGERDEVTISDTYKQVVLLAMGNPFQLMQGEAETVYEHMTDWSRLVKLARLSPRGALAGKFVIDLDADLPPRYIPSGTRGTRPADGRVVEVTDLLDMLSSQIEARDRAKGRAAMKQPNLAERMELDMYGRLKRSWGARFDRLSPRAPELSNVLMVAGLSGCNHFVGGEEAFTPEQDEIEIRKHRGLAGQSLQFALTPEDEEPWTPQEREARLKAGIDRPRTSEFDTEKVDDKDIWIKVYATTSSMNAQAQEQPRHEPKYSAISWRKRDESLGGLSVFCLNDCRSRVRVGEVVAYAANPDEGEQTWRIGVIRWLRARDHTGVELGIMTLSEDARAVATRAMEGVGKGGEYFRSLLVPRVNPLENPATLITPAAIYDVGTVLALNMKDDLIYVRLTRLVEATRSFAQFRFEVARTTGKPRAGGDTPRKERIFR